MSLQFGDLEMISARDFILAMSDDEVIRLIAEHEAFETCGRMEDDSFLRRTLDRFLAESGTGGSMGIVVASYLALEAYRRLAHLHLGARMAVQCEAASIEKRCETCRYYDVFVPREYDVDGVGSGICNVPHDLLPLSMQGTALREKETVAANATGCPLHAAHGGTEAGVVAEQQSAAA